jgi:hypothetical protein
MRSMAHPPYLRAKARSMRVDRRLTIDQIAERLALPRSTIYAWVRDLPVAHEVRHSCARQAARRRGNRAMQRKYRLLREAAYRDGLEGFARLAEDPTFRDFVCLYIAEGYKRDRNRVQISNSDPAVIQLACGWMRRLTTRPLVLSVQYDVDQDLDELCRFWGTLLGVRPDAIRMQRKSNSNHLSARTWRSRHGVLGVVAEDTLLRARLQAWMDRLRQSWR